MFNYKIFPFTAAFLFSMYIYLYGDIIVTNDGMILNGKILEEKKDEHIKLGNYHGIFTIDLKQIKEIHRTRHYEEDVKIFRDKGRTVDEAEVKTNYQSGVEKLENLGNAGEQVNNAEKIHPAVFTVLFSPYINLNIGKLFTVLPYGYGGAITGDIRLDKFKFFSGIYLKGIRLGMGYFHSEVGARRIIGLRGSAGPLWLFPLSNRKIHIDYAISPEIGVGWYSLRGGYGKADAVKWNVSLTTGPVFNIYSFILYPQIKFDYINDRSVPLYCVGFSLGLGYGF